jgi:hypothetical protein
MSGVGGLREQIQFLNSEDSSQISDHQVDQSHDSSWWEWCSDPRVEASILAISTLIALITWGLVDR